MRLIIARHAETTENSKGKDGVFHGFMHGKLSRKGMSQARRLAIRLLREKIDVICQSV